MIVLETDRLTLRFVIPDDAEFMLTLVNDPAFILHIGDRGIRSREHASNFIQDGPMSSYHDHGFGPYLVVLKNEQTPIGLCGLLKRANFEYADLGYALLPEFRGQGYAYEAASGVLAYAYRSLKLPRTLGLVSPQNAPSIRLLEKLGFQFQESRQLRSSGPPTSVYVHMP